MHSSLIGKVEKANRYARELDRITFDRLSLTFKGDNDTHHVTLDAASWHCTCHYFESFASCVHTLHHLEWSRPRSDQLGTFVQQLYVNVLAVTVRVGDDDLAGTCFRRPRDSGVHLQRH